MSTTIRSVDRVFNVGDRVTLYDPTWHLHGRSGEVIAVGSLQIRVKIDDPQDEHLVVKGSPLFFTKET